MQHEALNKIEHLFGNKKTVIQHDFTLKMVKQIHSNKCIYVDDINDKTTEVEADALVTKVPDIKLGIVTADCIPILLYDERNNIIGSVHAGWRGAASGIIQNTVEYMCKIGGSNSTTIAVIGPCIKKNSYEVGEDVYSTFCSVDDGAKLFFEEVILSDDGKKRYIFDLSEYCKSIMHRLNIGRIEDIAIDTFTNNEDFFSYRYAFKNGGMLLPHQRQISYIGPM